MPIISLPILSIVYFIVYYVFIIVMVISKLEILKMGRGPTTKFCGTGTHRDKKRHPKGNRSQLNRKSIQEY